MTDQRLGSSPSIQSDALDLESSRPKQPSSSIQFGDYVSVSSSNNVWRRLFRLGSIWNPGGATPLQVFIATTSCPRCGKPITIGSRIHSSGIRPLKASLEGHGGLYHNDDDCNETEGRFQEVGLLRQNGYCPADFMEGELIAVMKGQTLEEYSKVHSIVYDSAKCRTAPGYSVKESTSYRICLDPEGDFFKATETTDSSNLPAASVNLSNVIFDPDESVIKWLMSSPTVDSGQISRLQSALGREAAETND